MVEPAFYYLNLQQELCLETLAVLHYIGSASCSNCNPLFIVKFKAGINICFDIILSHFVVIVAY